MKKFFNKSLLKINVVLLLFFILLGGIPANFQSEEVKNPGEVFMESKSGFDYNFDPGTSYKTTETQFIQLGYETLITDDWNNPGLFLGILAESWSISSDGKTYTFILNQGIKYSDGTPFNAYTMKYSLDRMMLINDKQGPAYLLQEYILGGPDLLAKNDLNITDAQKYLSYGGITVPNDYTLIITLTKPYTPFLSILASFGHAISPDAIINNRPASYTTNQSDSLFGMVSLKDMFPNLQDWTKLGLDYNHDPAISGIVPQADISSPSVNKWAMNHMAGTGPYILQTYTNETIIMVQNSQWHGVFPSNSISKLTWTVEPDDDLRDLHFINGETDFHYNSYNLFDFINKDGESLIKGTTTYNKPALVNDFAYFNLDDNGTSFIQPAFDIEKSWNITHISNNKLLRFAYNNTYYASINNPFTALKFREAFAYALDYNAYLYEVFMNLFGIRSQGVIPKGMDGYQDDLIAKNIIPSQNLTVAKQLFQEVGWRGNITLINLNIRGVTDGSLYALLKAEIESLDVGITINNEIVNNTVYSQYYSNNPIKLTGWRADYNDAYNMVYGQLYSKGVISQYVTHYSNPNVDQLIEQTEFESDNTKRLNIFRQIEITTAEDYPFIYLWNQVNGFLLRDWLHGIKESGSLDAINIGLKWQYISKGDIATQIATSAKSNNNIPGFEFIALFILILPAFRKKITKNKS